MNPTKKKDNHSWKPIISILKHAKLPYGLIAINTVIALVYAQLILMFPDYTQQIYDGNFELKIAVTAVLIILAEALVIAVMQFVGQYTVAKVKYTLRDYIWRKLTRLPIEYYEENEPKEFISRLTTDMNSISDFMAFSISGAVSTIYEFLGSFVMLFGYDYRLAASQIIILPFCYIIGIIGGRVYFHFQSKIQGGLADMTGYVAGVLANLSLVKLFGQEKKEVQKGYFWINTYFKRNMEYNYAASAVEFANALVQVIQSLTVILFGVYLIHRDIITLDVWIAFYLYADMIFHSFNSVMEIWKNFKQSQGAIARVAETIQMEPEKSEGSITSVEGNELRFEEVCFGYKEEKQILNKVSFSIQPNAINAIVGPSGSGKSTILLLMDQLYRSYKGKILLNGHEAKEYDLNTWRNQFCYIAQDTPLFGGSIRDNILYGIKKSVSDEEILSACVKVGADDFIVSLENGLDTPMSVGGNGFSGGQRQRLALCRAMLTERPFIILDEALVSIDAIAAQKAFAALKELTADKTIILVTHSLERAKLADEVIVIKAGDVVAFGPASEVLTDTVVKNVFAEVQ